MADPDPVATVRGAGLDAEAERALLYGNAERELTARATARGLMRDERVEAAIRHWAGRFIANGIDYNDFVRTTAAVSALGRVVGRLDRDRRGPPGARPGRPRARGPAAAPGRPTCGPRSATTSRSSSGCWMRNATAATPMAAVAGAVRRPRTARSDRRARRGGDRRRHGSPPTCAARRATAASPLVVLIPGLDSTKEEFFHWESVFLDRGMATLSLDGPGQGETGLRMDIRPDYEVAVTAILDAVAGTAGPRRRSDRRRRREPRRPLRRPGGRV